MKCTRCGERVSQDMLDQVADHFDVDFEYPTCWNCAVEVFHEREQDQTMNNPPQDEDVPQPLTATEVKAMFAATDLSRDMAEARKPLEAGSNPSAGAAQSGGQLQIIRPGGGVQEILACGHDVSNRDTALESRTVFCRLCDLQGRCRDAEGREKELFDNYTSAAKLVADMHRAAMGCVCGPARGVVEDVADLKADRDAKEAALLGMYRWQAESVNELMPDELSEQVRTALGESLINAVILDGCTHGCHACGEERVPRMVAGRLTCPECGSENIVCIEDPE